MNAESSWWRYTEQGVLPCDANGRTESKPRLVAHLASTQDSIEVVDSEAVASLCWENRGSTHAFLEALATHLDHHQPDDDCARNSNAETLAFARTLEDQDAMSWVMMSLLRGEARKADRDRFARKEARAREPDTKHSARHRQMRGHPPPISARQCSPTRRKNTGQRGNRPLTRRERSLLSAQCAD